MIGKAVILLALALVAASATPLTMKGDATSLEMILGRIAALEEQNALLQQKVEVLSATRVVAPVMNSTIATSLSSKSDAPLAGTICFDWANNGNPFTSASTQWQSFFLNKKQGYFCTLQVRVV